VTLAGENFEPVEWGIKIDWAGGWYQTTAEFLKDGIRTTVVREGRSIRDLRG